MHVEYKTFLHIAQYRFVQQHFSYSALQLMHSSWLLSFKGITIPSSTWSTRRFTILWSWVCLAGWLSDVWDKWLLVALDLAFTWTQPGGNMDCLLDAKHSLEVWPSIQWYTLVKCSYPKFSILIRFHPLLMGQLTTWWQGWIVIRQTICLIIQTFSIVSICPAEVSLYTNQGHKQLTLYCVLSVDSRAKSKSIQHHKTVHL